MRSKRLRTHVLVRLHLERSVTVVRTATLVMARVKILDWPGLRRLHH